MGSGWSEEQAAQPASSSAATRSDEHGGNNSSNSLVEEVKVGHGLEAILKDADLAVDTGLPWISFMINSMLGSSCTNELSNTIEVVELLNVCWLEIHGKIKTYELSPGTWYEAAFVVMIKDPAYGWEVPVNIRLKKQDGSKQERKENLEERPRGRWVEIPIGDFTVHDRDENGGEIEFSMYECEGGMWKKGMLLKGVVIRTKGSRFENDK